MQETFQKKVNDILN